MRCSTPTAEAPTAGPHSRLPVRIALRHALSAVLVALTAAACASNAKVPDAPVEPLSEGYGASAAGGEEFERDAFGLALTEGNGNGAINDPWEKFNRRVHGFNERVDRYVARPVAVVYSNVTPTPIRRGITNVFTNLFQPAAAVNLLLQGRPKQAGGALARFGINLTLGIGGLFDPASDAGLQLRRADLGQTLGRWGWKDSRYLVLPFLGPTTVRDGMGTAGDYYVLPFRYIDKNRDRHLVQGLYLVDLRANALLAEELMGEVSDSYSLIRDVYLQRRRYMINSGDNSLPDYLFDLDDYDDLD